MFIKPIDAQNVTSGTWSDHAANTHFTLQSRKTQTGLVSMLSGIANLSFSSNQGKTNDTYLNSLLSYDFRVMLKTLKKDWIIAVAETFEKIRVDWSWIEANILPKILERDMNEKEVIDDQLLIHFEEMSEEHSEHQPSSFGQINQLRLNFANLVPQLSEEVVLCEYPCQYIHDEKNSIKGLIYITRNYLVFCLENIESMNDFQPILIHFKDILKLDLVPSTRLLGADMVQLSLKSRAFSFSLNASKQIYKLIAALCNSAMDKLINGAENSGSVDSYKFSLTAGDLSHNVQKSTHFHLKSRELHLKGRSNENIIEEEDFTQAMIVSPSKEVSVSDLLSIDQIENSAVEYHYAYLNLFNLFSLQDLETQMKEIEFRQVFKLDSTESILNQEELCTFIQKDSIFNGVIYLSSHFFNFISTNFTNGNGKPTQVPHYHTCSILFEQHVQALLTCSIPYSNIVSIRKQPPTALTGKLSSFSFTGYLQISTKSKGELWFSFNSLKSRDKWSELLLERMKTVDWRFDDQMIIGQWNPLESKMANSLSFAVSSSNPLSYNTNVSVNPSFGNSQSQSNPISTMSSLINSGNPFQGVNSPIPNMSSIHRPFQSSIEDLSKKPLASTETKSDQQLFIKYEKFLETMTVNNKTIQYFKVPLMQVFGPFSLQILNSKQDLLLWQQYFELFGQDICMIKDYKLIRELMIQTNGLPEVYRGDLWMLFSGAWHTRPEHEKYYQQLISLRKPSLFAEEIEKDLKRSLPEYAGFQKPQGVDALRRVLTSYSFRNPKIGYAQALNIISAVMLLYLKEADAFWMLTTLVEKLLPDHYTKTLVGSVVDQQVFTTIVAFHLPELHQHLTKSYIDLTTYSVPWFVCLFLNTVDLNIGLRILDGFFLDGPKFLFWLGLAILKQNEKDLLNKRDDEAFMRCLKNYFQEIGQENSNLFQETLTLAYSFSPTVTFDLIDVLRMKFRLNIVHEMEETYRKSQIRTICEQVELSFDEVGLIYDLTRQFEYERPEMDQTEEIYWLDFFFEKGGWGLIQTPSPEFNLPSKSNIHQDKKTISLMEFKKIFKKTSPWKYKLQPNSLSKRRSTRRKTFNKPKSVFNTLSTAQSTEQENWQFISIADRLFAYISFLHYKQALRDNNLGESNYTLKLGDFIHLLDTILKKPLQVKLRFLFDIHDVDGDGHLNKEELKEFMDSLIEIFEENEFIKKDEENFLRAFSVFLNSVLKSRKEDVPEADQSFKRNKSLKTLDDAIGFKLGFNEFLLCLLSQSVFVEFFELTWGLQKDEYGNILLKSS